MYAKYSHQSSNQKHYTKDSIIAGNEIIQYVQNSLISGIVYNPVHCKIAFLYNEQFESVNHLVYGIFSSQQKKLKLPKRNLLPIILF